MLLHLVQPCPRPNVWYHASGSPSLRVAGTAALLALRCLQVHATGSQHRVVLVGSSLAQQHAAAVGVDVYARLCPPLHSIARMGPAMRALLRQKSPYEAIVCWGGSQAAWQGLRRRALGSAGDARWLWIDGDAGTVHDLDDLSPIAASNAVTRLTLPSVAELALALPAPPRISLEAPLAHDRVLGLLGAPCSPGDAGKAAWLSTIVHTASVHHTLIACEASSVFVQAARRVLQERGNVRQLLLTQRPLLAWLHACEAVVVFAPGDVASRWSLGMLVHAALAREVPVVMSTPDAQVLRALGTQVQSLLLAESDSPSHIARALIPAMLNAPLARVTLGSKASVQTPTPSPSFTQCWNASTRGKATAKLESP